MRTGGKARTDAGQIERLERTTDMVSLTLWPNLQLPFAYHWHTGLDVPAFKSCENGQA